MSFFISQIYILEWDNRWIFVLYPMHMISSNNSLPQLQFLSYFAFLFLFLSKKTLKLSYELISCLELFYPSSNFPPYHLKITTYLMASKDAPPRNPKIHWLQRKWKIVGILNTVVKYQVKGRSWSTEPQNPVFTEPDKTGITGVQGSFI